MKLSDLLKKLGLNLDEEIDDAKEQTVVSEDDMKKNIVVEESDTKDEQVGKESKHLNLVYDDNTGLFDLSGIDNEDVKAILERANNNVTSKRNTAMIEKSISDKLGTLKISKGITRDAVLKLLDTSNISVEGDKVKGVDDAFNKLVAEQSGLFSNDKDVVVSSPVLEGFAPKDTERAYTEAEIIELAYGN